MQNIQEKLIKLFEAGAKNAFPELEEFQIEIAQSKHGHYQCNSAMKMAKQLRSNPRAIAEKWAESVDPSGMIASIEVAGPGFLNITLKDSWIEEQVSRMAEDPHLLVALPEKKQRIIVEFSSPNIAKELHVGHLRSTVIGDSLARIFEFLGHDVLRLNHVGDWGTAFGMLIAYLKEEHPKVLSGEEQTDLGHLVEWYRQSKKKFDEDPDFKKRSQLEVVALQGGNQQSREAWRLICEISRSSFQRIYDMLDVKLQERGESFYNPYLPEVVADFETKGLVKESEGAKCVFLDGFQNREGDPLPMIIQKSDGGFNYSTTDIAALRYRVQEDQAERIIVVTDAGQALHFQMAFEACRLAGYYDPEQVELNHVTFGLVLGPDGKKFRTRAGDTEPLIGLLENAISRAGEILDERANDLPPEEKKQLAKALGIGAVKYADLSCNRTGDYTFSYDRMLRFEGNTASFLMYAYVRVAGIKRKIGEPKKDARITLTHPSETALALHLLRFSELLKSVAQDLLPNRLAEYLYELAGHFNAFYRDCPVEGSAQQDSRLLLAETTARTLKQGLHLLGVETVERM